MTTTVRSVMLSAVERARALHWDLVPCVRDERDPEGDRVALDVLTNNKEVSLTAKRRQPWPKW